MLLHHGLILVGLPYSWAGKVGWTRLPAALPTAPVRSPGATARASPVTTSWTALGFRGVMAEITAKLHGHRVSVARCHRRCRRHRRRLAEGNGNRLQTLDLRHLLIPFPMTNVSHGGQAAGRMNTALKALYAPFCALLLLPEETTMLISSPMNSALNEQVGFEFAASLQYVAIAAHFDSESLPELARYYYRQADEEARMRCASSSSWWTRATESADSGYCRPPQPVHHHRGCRTKGAGGGDEGDAGDKRPGGSGSLGERPHHAELPAVVRGRAVGGFPAPRRCFGSCSAQASRTCCMWRSTWRGTGILTYRQPPEMPMPIAEAGAMGRSERRLIMYQTNDTQRTT